jgi:hypothetical protein
MCGFASVDWAFCIRRLTFITILITPLDFSAVVQFILFLKLNTSSRPVQFGPQLGLFKSSEEDEQES